MYLNNFSVKINGKKENFGYVEMNHGETYEIVLRNNHNVCCDAIVEIDGKEVGNFRINPNSNFFIERPVNEQKLFTFYQLGTRESRKTGLDKICREDIGLIKVTFKPEKKIKNNSYQQDNGTWFDKDATKYIFIKEDKDYSNNYNDFYYAQTDEHSCYIPRSISIGDTISMNNTCAGGTGLSGHSSQKFITASSISYDIDKITEINLRLVSKKGSIEDDDPIELKPVVHSTPVPPPVY